MDLEVTEGVDSEAVVVAVSVGEIVVVMEEAAAEEDLEEDTKWEEGWSTFFILLMQFHNQKRAHKHSPRVSCVFNILSCLMRF